MSSYRLSRNATVLLTGHRCGELRLHLLLLDSSLPLEELDGRRQQQRQDPGAAAACTDGAAAGATPPGPSCAAEGPRLALSLLKAFPAEEVLCGGGDHLEPGAAAGAAALPTATPTPSSACAPIAVLYAMGARGNVAAAAVALDASGRLAVLRHIGGDVSPDAGSSSGEHAGFSSLHHCLLAYAGNSSTTCICSLPCTASAPLPAAAVRFVQRAALGQSPLALRLSGAGAAAVLGGMGVFSQPLYAPAAAPPAAAAAAAADLNRGMAPPQQPSQPFYRPCHGLQNDSSTMVAAAMDARHGSRAYALTSDGRVLALTVGGERNTKPGCLVRAEAPLPAGVLPPRWAGAGVEADAAGGLVSLVAAAALPGYLLVLAGDSLAVLNATSALRRAPRLLLSQPLQALRDRFGVASPAAAQGVESEREREQQHGQQQQQQQPPLLATSRQGGHVAFLLNATVVALYRSRLPYRAPPRPYKGTGMALVQVSEGCGVGWGWVGGWWTAVSGGCGVGGGGRCRLLLAACGHPLCTSNPPPDTRLSSCTCTSLSRAAAAAAAGHRAGCGVCVPPWAPRQARRRRRREWMGQAGPPPGQRPPPPAV